MELQAPWSEAQACVLLIITTTIIFTYMYSVENFEPRCLEAVWTYIANINW